MADKCEKEKLYLKLISGYTRAYPSKTKTEVQKNVSEELQKMKKNPDLHQNVEVRLQEWKAREIKQKAKILSFWSKVSEAPPKAKHEKEGQLTNVVMIFSANESAVNLNAPSTSKVQSLKSLEVVASTPKQTQIKDDIIKQQIIIDTMNKKKDLGMISEEEKKSLIHEQKLLTTLKKSLHLAEGNQKRQQKLRDERKRCIAELDEETQKKK